MLVGDHEAAAGLRCDLRVATASTARVKEPARTTATKARNSSGSIVSCISNNVVHEERFIHVSRRPPENGTESQAKSGILNTGNVGSCLTRAWANVGHDLVLDKDGEDRKLTPLLSDLDGKVRLGTIREATDFGDVVLFSV
jgi:hypothetical protein